MGNKVANNNGRGYGGVIGILGLANSGKTTFAKHLQYVRGCGSASEPDREKIRKLLISNVLAAFRTLLDQAKKMEIDIMDEKACQAVLDANPDSELTPELISDIETLWKNEAIQRVFERRIAFDLPPHVDYFINNLRALLDHNNKLTMEDTLRFPSENVGLTEMQVNGGLYPGQSPWLIVDPGNRREERKRWPEFFANHAGMVFVVALDEWNVPSAVHPGKTRFEESLDLFAEIADLKMFRRTVSTPFDKYVQHTGWTILLNKCDLFQEKIKMVDLGLTFPQYKGGADYAKAIEFMKELVTSRIKCNDHGQPIAVVEVTCALDGNQLKQVFDAMEKFIVDASAVMA